MTSLTLPLLPPSQATFSSACENARFNLQSALDLIAVHREVTVRGRQPRTALNPAIAVAGVAVWERFVKDLLGAVTLDPTSVPQAAYAPGLYPPPGQKNAENGVAYPDSAHARLRNAGYLDEDNGKLSDRWVADVPTAWTGIRPTGWVAADAPQAKQLCVKYIAAAIAVRNAGAHSGQQALQRVAQEKQLPVLMSDAASGTTVQHGYAVGIVALIVQVIDSTIAAINDDRGWTGHRLPDDWFQFGPQTLARYSGIDFWHRMLPRA